MQLLPLLLLLAFALAGANVARRRGWPVLLAAVAAALLPPVGLAACAVFLADRVRDAVAAQEGGSPGSAPQPRSTPAAGARRDLPGAFGPRPGGARPTRERTPAPQPLPPTLEEGTVLRALRTYGPMTEGELLAALVDPPGEVRYQLRELHRRHAVAERQGRWIAR